MFAISVSDEHFAFVQIRQQHAFKDVSINSEQKVLEQHRDWGSIGAHE